MTKQLRLLATILALIVAQQTHAQLTREIENYQRFEASFVAETFKSINDNSTTVLVKPRGFDLGYIKSFNLTRRLPLFLELGGRLMWTHKNDSHSQDYDIRYTFLNVSIPLQLAYKFTFVSSDISIVPFFGPNFRFNFFGRQKYSVDNNGKELATKVKYLDRSNENPANIFQAGLNLGVGVNLSRLYIGYTFQPDLSDYVKYDNRNKLRTIYNMVTLGLTF